MAAVTRAGPVIGVAIAEVAERIVEAPQLHNAAAGACTELRAASLWTPRGRFSELFVPRLQCLRGAAQPQRRACFTHWLRSCILRKLFLNVVVAILNDLVARHHRGDARGRRLPSRHVAIAPPALAHAPHYRGCGDLTPHERRRRLLAP